MSDEQESFDLFGDMHPYNKLFKVHDRLPEKGRDEEEVLKELQYMAGKENPKWLGGQCSGTMYHGGMEHYAFLNKVFNLYSFVNLLQRDLCPSGTKFEAEVLAMVGKMLHGERSAGQPPDEGRRHHFRRHGGTNAMLYHEGGPQSLTARLVASNHPPRPPEGRAPAGHEAHPPAG
jgi:hypothetical protein